MAFCASAGVSGGRCVLPSGVGAWAAEMATVCSSGSLKAQASVRYHPRCHIAEDLAENWRDLDGGRLYARRPGFCSLPKTNSRALAGSRGFAIGIDRVQRRCSAHKRSVVVKADAGESDKGEGNKKEPKDSLDSKNGGTRRQQKGPQIVELRLDEIRRPLLRTRANDPEKVKYLMQSIAEIGLQEPIDVLEVDGIYYGFSGCHRYEAHQRLGLLTIKCRVRRGTKSTLKMHMM